MAAASRVPSSQSIAAPSPASTQSRAAAESGALSQTTHTASKPSWMNRPIRS